MKVKIFHIFFSLIMLFVISYSVSALTISHPIIELTANPGETLNFAVSLTNNETETKTFYADVRNFKAGAEEGRPEFFDGEEGISGLASWLKLPSAQITLAPREKQEIKFTIEVPQSAEPGGHYAALLWGTAPALKEGEVGISGKTGHLILLKVSGVIKEQGKVLGFKAAENFNSRLPVDFNIDFANEGNVHLKPIGQIEIKNIFGRQTAIVPLNLERKNVLPASQRTLDVIWFREDYALAEGGLFSAKGGLLSAVGELIAEFQNEISQFAFGRYTATAAVIFGSQNETVFVETAFWVIPWMLILAGILTLIALAIFVRWYNAYIIRRALKDYQSNH